MKNGHKKPVKEEVVLAADQVVEEAAVAEVVAVVTHEAVHAADRHAVDAVHVAHHHAVNEAHAALHHPPDGHDHEAPHESRTSLNRRSESEVQVPIERLESLDPNLDQNLDPDQPVDVDPDPSRDNTVSAITISSLNSPVVRNTSA